MTDMKFDRLMNALAVPLALAGVVIGLYWAITSDSWIRYVYFVGAGFFASEAWDAFRKAIRLHMELREIDRLFR